MPAILYHLYYFYIILKGIDFAGKTVRILPFLFILLIFFAGYRLISIYLVNDFNLWLGLVLAPFILYVRKPYGHSVRFGLISIACLIIYHFVPVLSLYYIAFCSAILFVIENTTGKLNSGVFVLIVLLGSVTRYFVNIFGFAIRLKLTAAAGWLLNMAGYANRVEGNIIVHNNISFSVDEACMGLKMVITAFLVMLLFLTFFERRSNKYLPLWGIALLGITTMVLVIFGNLLRIMALVVLKCPPDAWSHEVIGIAGFILYVLLPLYLITPFIISFLGKKVNPYSMSRRSGKKKMLVLAPFLAGGLFLLNLFYEVKAMPADDYYASAGFTGFKKEICHHNIIKFYNDSTLIYIKPPAAFYGSDHNPSICWLGSGYSFENINTTTINGCEIYTATLEKEGSRLYTAWWFDNGEHKTIEQFSWRWNSLKGQAPYRLINVTCETGDKLLEEVTKLINTSMI